MSDMKYFPSEAIPYTHIPPSCMQYSNQSYSQQSLTSFTLWREKNDLKHFEILIVPSSKYWRHEYNLPDS